MKKEKSLVVKDRSVETFISQAIQANVPVETMERLLAMRKDVLTEKAKEAFVQSMSNFQEKCPIIKKTKKVLNKDGRTVRYQYAPLDSIVEQIKKPIKECNLSYRWETKNEEKMIKAICTVTHILGHSESSEFAVPIDTEGYMTAPQKYASALTFSKRYSLCNALGISTGDEDDDSLSSKKEPDSKSVKSQITLRLRALNEKTSNKEDIQEAVLRLTQLELKDENFSEIASRLQVLINEKNAN